MTPAAAPVRRVLGNGLTVIHQHNPASAAVTISLSFPAGSALDPEERSGLASLVARGLTRGTSRRTKQEIGEVLDFRGAHLAGQAGRHTGGLVAKARCEDFEVVLELAIECARCSAFPEAEVAKLVGDRLTALREEDDDPSVLAGRLLRELIYSPGHPYARRHLGTAESVSAIAPEELRRFHGARFRPAQGLLVVVGGVEAEPALEAIERIAGEWPDQPLPGGFRGAHAQIAEAPGLEAVRERRVTMPDKAQVEIALGHPGIRRDDPGYYRAALMNAVLGRFAMGGRLGRSVREEQGLAYYAYSVLDATLGPGPFVVRAGVAPAHVEVAVRSIVAEMERMRREPVGHEELEDARSATVRSLPLTLESNEGIAGVLLQIELHDLGADYLDRFPGLLQEVTPEGILEEAGRLLHPHAYGLAVAGPAAPERGS